MMTSITTFETTFRNQLLDILYSQFAKLGAPFAEVNDAYPDEVIDPESLIWCALEFLPTEPRLAEAVTQWVRSHEKYIVRQRINRNSLDSDPRVIIWNAWILVRHDRARRVLSCPSNRVTGWNPLRRFYFSRSRSLNRDLKRNTQAND